MLQSLFCGEDENWDVPCLYNAENDMMLSSECITSTSYEFFYEEPLFDALLKWQVIFYPEKDAFWELKGIPAF